MKDRFLLGLLILVCAAALLVLAPSVCEFLGLCPKSVTVVYGEIGGSKEGLFLDSDVQKILKDKYGLDVRYKTLGGEDQVCSPPAQTRDFVWPGTEITVERYKQCHDGKTGKGVETVLISPIVFYSWAPETNAFAHQGWLTDTLGIYYLDMQTFTPVLMEGRPWKAIGLTPTGSINVVSTDPASSNSGQVWFALLATMLNNGELPNVNTIQPVLPDVKKYFDRQGFMLKKSIDLFNRYITVGEGDKPIIVGYESLLADYIYQSQQEGDSAQGCAVITSMGVRIIYPRPTIWASHPLIAETDNGVTLQQRLLDPEIQRLAWERHGFRAPLGKVSSLQAVNCLKVPATIDSTIPLPTADVMDILIKVFKK